MEIFISKNGITQYKCMYGAINEIGSRCVAHAAHSSVAHKRTINTHFIVSNFSTKGKKHTHTHFALVLFVLPSTPFWWFCYFGTVNKNCCSHNSLCDSLNRCFFMFNTKAENHVVFDVIRDLFPSIYEFYVFVSLSVWNVDGCRRCQQLKEVERKA